MASLTRAGLEPGLLARTTLHYGEEQFPVELTIDTRGEDAGFIDFAHDTRDTRSPERISYRIWLTSSQPNYGGGAIGSAAPGRAAAAKLFLPLGGHQFLSREAYRLGYACQRETRTDRLMHKARRVHRAIGAKATRSRRMLRRSPRGCSGELMSGNSPPGWRRHRQQMKPSQSGLDASSG
jgi:hypothetical protein